MPLAILSPAAAAGTRRLPLDSLAQAAQQHPAGKALLGALQQEHAPDARRLLRAASVASVLQRCQWWPKASACAGSSAPMDARPALQEPTIVQTMRELLQGDALSWQVHLRLRARLLRSMQRCHLRLPRPLLRACLERNDKSNELQRPLLLPVLGTWGRWLARQGNPRWKWAHDGTPLEELDVATHGADEVWQRGSMHARLALLQRERMLEPARARTRLEQGFARGGGLLVHAREYFFPVMARNLSMEDAPFLERCLKDRSDFVQTLAAELLATLVHSQPSQRICAVLRGLVRHSEQGKWYLVWPRAFDAAWEPLGLRQYPSQGGSNKDNQQKWWLQQLVSSAPLSFWQEAGLPPAGLFVRRDGRADWTDPIRAGWLKATCLAMQAGQDLPAGWLDTILPMMDRRLHRQAGIHRLLPWLDAARREDWWRMQLQRGEGRPVWALIEEMHEVLEGTGISLSGELSRCLLQHIRGDLAHALREPLAAKQYRQQTDFGTRLWEAVHVLHGSALAEFAAWFEAMDWKTAFGAEHRELTSPFGMLRNVRDHLHWCEKLHRCEQAMQALAGRGENAR